MHPLGITGRWLNGEHSLQIIWGISFAVNLLLVMVRKWNSLRDKIFYASKNKTIQLFTSSRGMGMMNYYEDWFVFGLDVAVRPIIFFSVKICISSRRLYNSSSYDSNPIILLLFRICVHVVSGGGRWYLNRIFLLALNIRGFNRHALCQINHPMRSWGNILRKK